MAFDLMDLGIPIRVNQEEAIAAMQKVERAGKQIASQYASGWGKANTDVGAGFSLAAAAAARAQAATVAAAAAAQAAAARRAAAQTAIEAKLAAHFTQMRQKEVAAAEAAAYAQEAAYQRQAAGAERSAQRQAAANVAAANTMTKKYGTAALGIAGGLQAIAFSGDLSAGALKGMLTQVGLLAASFGPQGQLIAAAAVGTSAVIGIFTRAREEAEKTRKAFAGELDKMVDAGDRAGIMAQAAVRFRGSPSLGFKDSMGAMQAEIDRLSPKNALQGVGQMFNAPKIAEGFRKLTLASGDSVESLDDLRKKLKEVQAEYSALVAQLNDPKMPFRPAGATTITTAVSVEAEQAAAQAEAARRRLTRTRPVFKPLGTGAEIGYGPGLAGNAAAVVAQNQAILDEQMAKVAAHLTDMQAKGEALAQSVGAGIMNALTAGLQSAFAGDLSGAFKSLTAGILSSLGGMFVEMGKHVLLFGKIMTSLKNALTNFFTAGPASILAGVALIALGAAMGAAAGGIAGSGGGGGGGSRGGWGNFAAGGGASTPSALGGRSFGANTFMGSPAPASALPAITFSPVILGASDPAVPRFLADGLNEALARGMKVNLRPA